MLIKDILETQRPTFSFEFFPPKKAESWERLFRTVSSLIPLKPSYVSVTYGAGGATRENTRELVLRIHRETDLTVVAHLTCVGTGRDEAERLLETYAENGIENILALRGDPPKDQEWTKPDDGFFYAMDLVAFIRDRFPGMCIGVAGFPEGHPATPNRLREIEILKAKVDAGADYIVTQLFFDNRDFYDFRERCGLEGISVPVIAGVMPITTRRGMVRMAELAAGARIPARLLKAVGRAESDEGVEQVGVHWATEQVRDLIDNGARGIHFYTLNRSKATLNIYRALGVRDSSQLSG